MILEFLILVHSWYPVACCGGEDCRPVPAESVVEHEEGVWEYLPLKLLFPKSRVYPSLDSHYHVCYSKSNDPYCIFVLQGA